MKNLLVIGGGTGIGLGAAEYFLQQGYRVVIAGRRESVLADAVSSLQAEDDSLPVWGRTVDVADRTSVVELVRWATEKMGQIDVVVNAAGVNIKNRTMLDMQPEQWDHILAINATGVYNVLWAVLPQMRSRQDGLFINISSIAGKRAANLAGIAYCGSKFAATGLGTAVGLEEAHRGIRITNVYPGEVETPLLDQRPAPVSEERRRTMLQPSDIASVLYSIAELPARAHVPELVIKPTVQDYA
ncbi:MAG: SDR family NAD(P)-dependent oxidoreductase [Planctomycetales bacterium]|nr:SDR family NAD(P)-dependent oxidoreductase [Planctomycetales bacterium]